MNLENMEDKGYKPAPVDYFSKRAWIKPLVPADDKTNCSMSDVAFEPGCRNNWHTHPGNQILMVKEGTCYYGEEGEPVKKLEVGEVVNILPGVKHWHGASPEARCSSD